MNKKQANRKPMSEEESLKRSHSPLSNAKLTFVCLAYTLVLNGFFASLAAVGTGLLPDGILWAVLAGCAALTALCLWGLSRFRR